ncbi:MAG: periplasmic heavy metal sensor [Pyrinomonadaceae bacterium]
MKTKAGLVVLLVTGLLLSVVLTSAQQPQPPPTENDPLGEAVFPPELVMQHQREIGLTDEQKAFMRGEIQRVTVRFNELQWQLQDAMEALGSTMKEGAVNEQQALAQLDKVLDAEREIKHLHIGLAIRIKNKLTLEQQAKLQGFKRMQGQGPGPRPGPALGPNPRPMP